MPLFEFVCTKCHNSFSLLCNKNTEETKCECGNMAQKVLSTPNWVFNTSCSNPLPPKEKTITELSNNRQSRILFDFFCPNCETSDERLIYLSEKDEQYCNKCNSKLSSELKSTKYELKYNPKTDMCDWSGNTSQYWKAVKEERRQGKQVKGLGEI